MSDRRLPALLAAIAGAAVLAAAGAWFLRDADPGAPGGVPAEPEAPGPGDTHPVPPRGAPPHGPQPVPPPQPATKAWGRLRLVDESTRLPVPYGRGCHVHMAVEEESRALRAPIPVLRVEEGRWVLGWPYGKDNDPRRTFPKASADAARIEVRVPGYARLEVPVAGSLDGEKEHAMRPVPPSVKGEFRGGPEVAGESFVCDLLPLASRIEPILSGVGVPDAGPPLMPDRPGPFRIFDIPQGRWRLVARVSVGTETARAVRDFEVKEGTTDLGEIPLLAPVTLRARVVGRDGTGVLDAGLGLSRGDEAADLPSAGTPAPDKEGWVEFRGLEAGAEYVVTASRFEGLKRTVHAPAEGGKTVSVELSSELHGVLCRIRFTVNGQDALKWGDILDGPTLDEGAWKKDGRIEQEMAPGEYGFTIWAQPVGKDGLVAVRGTFTVPEGKRDWEKTVDLREGE